MTRTLQQPDMQPISGDIRAHTMGMLVGGLILAALLCVGNARASTLDHNVALSSLGAQAFDNGNWIEQSPGGAGWQYDANLTIDDDPRGASAWFGIGSLPQQQMWVVFDRERLIDAIYIDELSFAFATGGMLEYRHDGTWFPVVSFSKDSADYLVTFAPQRADAVRLTITSSAVPGSWLNVASGVFSLEVRESTSTCPITTADADGDGEADATDACPGTAAGAGVDSAGCSQAQFCATFDATTARGGRECRAADWKNDEPLLRANGKGNCIVDKGTTRGRTDDRCVPRP